MNLEHKIGLRVLGLYGQACVAANRFDTVIRGEKVAPYENVVDAVDRVMDLEEGDIWSIMPGGEEWDNRDNDPDLDEQLAFYRIWKRLFYGD